MNGSYKYDYKETGTEKSESDEVYIIVNKPFADFITRLKEFGSYAQVNFKHLYNPLFNSLRKRESQKQLNIFNNKKFISNLFDTALYKEEAIDIAEDVVGWIDINNNELLQANISEVHVISGKPFAEYMLQNHELSTEEKAILQNGIIIVVLNKRGDVLKYQTITSDKGLSKASSDIFNGNNMITVTL